MKAHKRVFSILLLVVVAAVCSHAQTYTVIATFGNSPAETPVGRLVQGLDGNLYGATGSGGDTTNVNCAPFGCGTVFRVSPGGAFAVIHTFEYTDGAFPSDGLTLATDGNFYGPTYGGGTSIAEAGTLFRVTEEGTLTTIYNFQETDGIKSPNTTLVQGTDGYLYGTITSGSLIFRSSLAGDFADVYTPPTTGMLPILLGNWYRLTTANSMGVRSAVER